MATQMANDFTYFDQSPAEARAGSILSVDQIQSIQNKLAIAAIEKINIEDNPLNPQIASLRRAKLDGEIGAYRFLIIGSEEAVKAAYDEAAATARLDEQKRQYNNAYQVFSAGSKVSSPSTISQ